MNRTINLTKEGNQRNIALNADRIWKCAHHYLWSKYSFSEKEIAQAKNHIKEYFNEILPEVYFKYEEEKVMEYSIRILLVNEYLKRKNGRFIPHPVIWFNPNNPHGFAGTKKWFTSYMEMTKYENIRFYHENGKMIIRKDSNGFKSSNN